MTDAVRPALRKPTINGTKPGINAKLRTWTSKDGQTFTLRKISAGAMQRIASNPEGKPRIPQVTVHYGDNQFGTESNPNDPAYVEALADWQGRNQYQAMLYTLGNGVVLDVEPDFKQQHLAEFPDASEYEIRYFYLTMLVEINELTDLMNAILGQTSPTEDGIAEAEASFPGAQ